MRFLLLLLWSLLPLLEGSVRDCNWKMPLEYDNNVYVPDEYCEQKIKWKAHDENEAHATCLEYFPTTFVSARIDPLDENKIICSVQRQFQCNFLTDSVTIFDKCYTFETTEMAMDKYKAAEGEAKCRANGGTLPIFYSMTQAKHIAKEAHRKGIYKMWVNVDKDGKTIENCKKDENGKIKCELTGDKGFLLYKNQWKLHKDHYWKGDELKATPKFASGDQKGEPDFPAEAKHLFFRTKTDYFLNMYQGSFERATETTTASIVCEYPAKIVPSMKSYCARMDNMGFNAIYDDRYEKKRCIYASLSKYPLLGTRQAIHGFKGCGEKPSEEHSSGIDDGTANKFAYDSLTTGNINKGTYRVAAIKMDTTGVSGIMSQSYLQNIREHCKGGAATQAHRQPFRIYDHFDKEDFSGKMTSPWNSDYPKDECTDFPNTADMHSNALAIREGQIVDVPTAVRLPVLCSIAANVDCEKNTETCKNDVAPKLCKNVNEWNKDIGLYAKCECESEKHTDENCKWLNDPGNICGAVYSRSGNKWMDIKATGWTTLSYDTANVKFGDEVNRVVVHRGCWMTVWSHPAGTSQNYELLSKVRYGDHIVPNSQDGNQNGWTSEMDASAIECGCDGVNY